MTERWRAELSRLPRLDDPTSAWHRASTRVPSEPPPQLPPTRQRIAAAVVALVVFAGAGVFAYSAFDGDARPIGGPAQPEPIVVHLASGDGTSFDPSAYLVYEDRKADTCAGWFVVFPDGTGEAQDMKCAYTDAPLEVPVGTPFHFETGGDDVTTQVEPADATATPGEKTVRIFASWASTDLWNDAGAEFQVTIEVVEVDPSASQAASVSPSGQDDPASSPEAVGSAGVPDVLSLRCGPHGIEILTPVVAVQSDGLHIDADVTGFPDPEVAIESHLHLDRGSWWSGSSGTDGEFARAVPPGPATIWCEPGPGQNMDAPDPSRVTAEIEIVDPQGEWVDHVPTCDRIRSIGPAASPTERADTPVEAVRRGVAGILDTDVVEEAGYVGGDDAAWIVRVIREGEIVASFHVSRLEYPSVVAGSVCPSADFGPLVYNAEDLDP